MGFQKLPSNSKVLLDALVNADNPTNELCTRWDVAVGAEMDELKGIISELRQLGYINVKFADNKPYIVTLTNSARTYNERLTDYEASQKSTPVYYDHSVRIGDGNKITKSIIGSNVNTSNPPEKKRFWNNHPLLVGIVGAVVAGVILMFSFWESIVAFIEGLL